MVGRHTVGLEQEGYFGAGVETLNWKAVSDSELKLKLKLVRKITRGTLIADPEIVHAGALNFHAGNLTRIPRKLGPAVQEIEMTRCIRSREKSDEKYSPYNKQKNQLQHASVIHSGKVRP